MTKPTMQISESANLALGKVEGKKRWKAKIIGVGKGSKAIYTTEAIASVTQAFPKGTKVNADHQTWQEKADRPEGSVKSIIGIIATDPYVEDDGAYTEIEFVEAWAPTIEQIGKYLGLSIHAQGEWETESEDGFPIITSFIPHPLNSVDLVTVAGAKGRLVEVMESIGQVEEPKEKERKNMTPEEMDALVSRIVAELKPETEEVVESVSVDISEVTEALISAKLPEAARKQVYISVENGVELEEAIKVQKDYVKDVTKNLKELYEADGVRKMAGDKASADDYSVGGWN